MYAKTLRRLALILAASAVMSPAPDGTSAAQAWAPTHPVEIIIGAGPGGGADRSGRFLQNIMRDEKLIPVPAVVVNKPGAGGAIALSHLLQQTDSGHHLMVASPTLLSAYIVGRTPTPPSEVTPLALLYTEYMMLAVKSDSPIKNGRDFIERLRADPQSLSITVGVGVGNMNHIAAAQPL
jgi:putative tricarboxylic transport membrane protein